MATPRRTFGKRGIEHGDRPQWTRPQADLLEIEQDYRHLLNLENSDETADTLPSAALSISSMLFSFDGRIRRLPYWGITLLCDLVMWTLFSFIGINVLDLITFNVQTANLHLENNSFVPLLLAAGLVGYIRTVAEVRRFHDRDKSGLWSFACPIPVIGLWFLFANSVFAGTPGRNRFGD